jgi:adenylosuccinate synthase
MCYFLRYHAGLVNPGCIGVIGAGVVVHLPSLFSELDALQSQGVFLVLRALKS